MAGSSPLWDPYAAAGQAAFSDALNPLFPPPVLLLRALPAVPGFNLLVAAPFPLAALGMWLFLRRHVSEASAALGAIVFSASGPVVSTGGFPSFLIVSIVTALTLAVVARRHVPIATPFESSARADRSERR
jgi:hypothetical protein